MPAWVYPVAAAAMMMGGTAMNARAQNKAQNKQMRAQSDQFVREQEARRRAVLARTREATRQAEFERQRQGHIANAARANTGEQRDADLAENKANRTSSLRGAVKGEVKAGNLQPAAKTSGRVSKKLGAKQKKANKGNAKESQRLTGQLSTIGSYKDLSVDQNQSMGALGQAISQLGIQAQGSNQMNQQLAQLLGQVGPEPFTIINPNSLVGDLLYAGGQGVGAYAPYAGGGGGGGFDVSPSGNYGGPGAVNGFQHGGASGSFGPNNVPWAGP